jgi:hypothetical protein
MTTVVYHYDVLHQAHIIVRLILGCLAASLWILFLREILFKSGRVQTHWVKRRLLDLLVMLSIAVVTVVFALIVGGITSHRGR